MASPIYVAALLWLGLLFCATRVGSQQIWIKEIGKAEAAIPPAEDAIKKTIQVALTFSNIEGISSCVDYFEYGLVHLKVIAVALKEGNVTLARDKAGATIFCVLACARSYVLQPPPLLRSAIDVSQEKVNMLIDAIGR